MNHLPKFQEEYSAKIPALTLLVSLGWNFLSPAQALAAREHKTSEVVLKNILREELKKRHFHYAGKDYPLSEKAIDTLLSEVCNPALNEGLGVANCSDLHLKTLRTALDAICGQN